MVLGENGYVYFAAGSIFFHFFMVNTGTLLTFPTSLSKVTHNIAILFSAGSEGGGLARMWQGRGHRVCPWSGPNHDDEEAMDKPR